MTILVCIVTLLVVSAPLWQVRWVKAPSGSVRFEPRKVVTAAELGPDSAFGWLQKASESVQDSDSRQALKKELKLLNHQVWADETLPELTIALEKNMPALEFARKAATAPDLVVPTNTSLLEDNKYLGNSITLAQLLCASASRDAAQGNFEAMTNDLEHTTRLAGLVSSGGSVLNTLVGLAMIQMAANRAMVLATGHTLPESISSRLTKLFEQVESALPDRAEVLRYEAAMLLNELEVVYRRSEPTSDQQVKVGAAVLPIAALAGSTFESTRRNTKWFLEHLIGLAEQGDDETQARQLIIDLKTRFQGYHSFLMMRDPVGYLFVSLSTPAYLGLHHKLQFTRCSLRGAVLVLAIERFRRERGEFPSDLDALVPKWSSRIPADPYSQKSLRFLPTPGEVSQYRIYSVGPNGIDDGGTRPKGSFPSPDNKKLKEDYVIFPLPEK